MTVSAEYNNWYYDAPSTTKHKVYGIFYNTLPRPRLHSVEKQME